MGIDSYWEKIKFKAGGGPGSKNKLSSYDRSRGDLEDVEDRIKKYCS